MVSDVSPRPNNWRSKGRDKRYIQWKSQATVRALLSTKTESHTYRCDKHANNISDHLRTCIYSLVMPSHSQKKKPNLHQTQRQPISSFSAHSPSILRTPNIHSHYLKHHTLKSGFRKARNFFSKNTRTTRNKYHPESFDKHACAETRDLKIVSSHFSLSLSSPATPPPLNSSLFSRKKKREIFPNSREKATILYLENGRWAVTMMVWWLLKTRWCRRGAGAALKQSRRWWRSLAH